MKPLFQNFLYLLQQLGKEKELFHPMHALVFLPRQSEVINLSVDGII
jgi:hypothetical protein